MFYVLLLAAVLFGAGCQSDSKIEKEERGDMPARDINLVMQDHTTELMALPGVVGVYIGARDDSSLCIRVMVVKRTAELEQEIPSNLEGHPVEIDETGEIRPM